VLLFSDSFGQDIDFKQHFIANHRWFFILAALLPPLDALDTLFKGWDHFLAQGLLYPATLLILFVFSVVGALTKHERFHAFYAVFFFIYILLFIGINLSTLA
jgi:hypothetical protein